MDCPACGHRSIAFDVPTELREHAPGKRAAICPRCLTLEPADDAPGDSGPPAIIDAFPEGEAGAAMALCVGLVVDSLALNRDAIGDCIAFVSDRGADPWLVLERLTAAGSVQPDADLERARRQLQQLLR